MPEKSPKMLARLPRGFADRTPDDIRAAETMMATIREVYELYGFEPADQPLIEYTDALGKFLPDQDRPNEGVFSFRDDDVQEARSGGAATGKEGEWLSLRYDLTAPMARYVAENFEKLPKPFRSYRAGWVFRNEKPGPGRFRQFMQFDADTVGTPGVAADAEMCMMMADVMEALGIPRGQYVIRVNNRIFLESLIKAVARTEQGAFVETLGVMRSLDKLDRLGWDGVKLLLTKGRHDESGDFTIGNGLSDVSAKILVDQLRVAAELNVQASAEFSPTEAEADVRNFFSQLLVQYQQAVLGGEIDISNPEVRAHSLGLQIALGKQVKGFNNAKEILELVRGCGYGPDRIAFDPTCVRGLEYYTGPVFEAELLAEIPNEDGQIVRFGSVGGGGRYDGLVSRFRGEPVPATGFSIGVSRLLTALKNLGKLDTSDVLGPVVVLVMDRDTESLGRYQKMVSELRQAGIRAEMYLGGSGMKPQMKYADRRKAPCVVIQGGDERKAGTVQIKDMVVGAELAANIAGHDAYKEARPGQVTVPETELVETVRAMIAAQRVDRS